MSNRPNNAIWKIQARDGLSPEQLLSHVIEQYQKKVDDNPRKHSKLQSVALSEGQQNNNIHLYMRKRIVGGMYSFVKDYLHSSAEEKDFAYYPIDTCLFIVTSDNLYVVTSGSGYHIIEDFVDYSFPFEVAKKVVANSFTAAEKRKFAGAALNINEKYRRDYIIDKSKSLDSIWKSLIGKVDPTQLPNNNFLSEIIDPDKPPTAEIKSSFTLKKSLSLGDIIKLINAIETLPEPTGDHKKAMEFLDCLQPVKVGSLRKKLKAQLIETIRRAISGEISVDFDICDPKDIDRYHGGSNYAIGSNELSDNHPDIDEVIKALGEQFGEILEDEDKFVKSVCGASFTYTVGEDGELISNNILSMFHGQLELDGQVYFLMDNNWYRGQGDFLKLLLEDFVEQIFCSPSPTFIDAKSNISLLEWKNDWNEGDFNKEQAKVAGYYYGDEIFLRKGHGKIELFDLLYIDIENKNTYIIHVKDDFDAKMRDVCSQISTARDVIESAAKSDMGELKTYYSEWVKNKINADKNVDETTFLGWFGKDYTKIYIVVCSTNNNFTVDEFNKNIKMQSYVAKREILATREDFRGKDNQFHLTHSKKEAKSE